MGGSAGGGWRAIWQVAKLEEVARLVEGDVL
jgi:hypothetical protein